MLLWVVTYFCVCSLETKVASLRSILFYSILGCVLPLQEVALRQSLPSFSVLCYPHPYRSLLPHNVISPATFWSSGWSYTLCLPLCASNSPSIIFHSGDVSSPFPFRINYVLDYVCHSVYVCHVFADHKKTKLLLLSSLLFFSFGRCCHRRRSSCCYRCFCSSSSS